MQTFVFFAFCETKTKRRRREDRRRNIAEISCGQTVEPTRRPLGPAEAAVASSIDSPLHSGMLRTCGHAEPLTQFWGWLTRVDAVTGLLLGYQGRGQEREGGRKGRKERGAGRAHGVNDRLWLMFCRWLQVLKKPFQGQRGSIPAEKSEQFGSAKLHLLLNKVSSVRG